ncbi:MAG: hypothetical protein VW684_11170, partial [Betaproteobacteria bacterium]
MKTSLVLIFTTCCLSGCALDKQRHFFAGVAVSGWVYAETGDRLKACLAALGTGVAMELVAARRHHSDPQEGAASAAGGGRPGAG